MKFFLVAKKLKILITVIACLLLSMFGLLLSACNHSYAIRFFNSPSAFNQIINNNKDVTMYVGSSWCPFCHAYKDLPEGKINQLNSYLNDGNIGAVTNLLNKYKGDGPMNLYAMKHTVYGYFQPGLQIEHEKPFPTWVRADIINQLHEGTQLDLNNGNWSRGNRFQPGSIPITMTWHNGLVVKWTAGFLTGTQLNGFMNYKV